MSVFRGQRPTPGPSPAQVLAAARVKGFKAAVDARVREFGLSPDLPEILSLKHGATSLLEGASWKDAWDTSLSNLDPKKDALWSPADRHLTVCQCLTGFVLTPQSLINFFFAEPEVRSFSRIRLDADGIRIYDKRGERVHYHAGAPGLHELPGPNGVQNAAIVVNFFTGLDLSWEVLRCFVWAEFKLVGGLSWVAEYGTEPAATS